MANLSCVNGVLEDLNGELFCHCSSAVWYGEQCSDHFSHISDLFYTSWIIHQIIAFVMIFSIGVYAILAIVYIKNGYMGNIKLSWRSCYTFGMIAIGCVLRCFLLVDIWGFHGIYGEDFAYLIYFVSYGFWVSAFMMEYGIWWQIVIDSGKLKLNTHWRKAVIFMVVTSVLFGAVMVIIIPVLWVVGDSLSVKGIIGILVVGVIFLLLVVSIPSGVFVLFRMKKFALRNKDLRKQTVLIVLLGFAELVFLLLAISQIVVGSTYPDGTITGNYFTSYINWTYRVLDGWLLFLAVYALCDSPLKMVQKTRTGVVVSAKTAHSAKSTKNDDELSISDDSYSFSK
eukprot:TRINITY_DN5672_c0_g1_i1.p1 TRINITY_DN5672_c0_g1~~TRINITY_DN5672_c0_g1_i1.p1  ORF type:complete len:341 (-),score=29.08 TRINITY_DN5672_c0_g1_i1:42-1064(-)